MNENKLFKINKMKNTGLLLSCLGVIAFVCLSNSCKIVRRADSHFEYFEYTKAIPLYKKVVEKDSTNAMAWAKLGDCYRMNNQTEEAEMSYKEAVKSPKTAEIYKLYYAQMMVNNLKYAEAHEVIDDYLKSSPGDERAILLDSGISHKDNFLINKDKFSVQKININSEDGDFCPVLFREGIAFTSSRPSDSRGNHLHSWTGKRYYSIYYAKGSETNFETPSIFLEGVQTQYNNSTLCFSKDGNEMILTRNNIEKGKIKLGADSTVRLKLYFSVLKNENWSDVVPFKYNSDQYSCAHPALSTDGSKLYFSSDMPGSIGGMDLWVSSRTNDGWSQPENLGPNVNTTGNEIFPTVMDDGTIYYSSNGHEGLGGLDIYSTKESDGKYSIAENAGAPINSSDDDFGFIWDTKNRVGYLSSNRTHQGYNDDIYCLTKNFVDLLSYVYDKQTGEPVDRSRIRIISEDTLVQTMLTENNTSPSQKIRRDKNYKLIIESENYKTDTVELGSGYFRSCGDSLVVKIPLEKDETLMAMEGKIFNDASKIPVSDARLMLINSTCNDTLWTTTGADGNYSFTHLEKDSRYKLVVESPYSLPYSIDTSTVGLASNATIHRNIGLYCLSENMVLNNIYYDLNKAAIRPDAAMELNKLAALMKQNPKIKIELGSHTDSRASADYNMKLSKRRAKSAVEYLMKHGVEKDRMVAQGYGEIKLVNNCVDEGDTKVYCTEEEHQLNRRTEIRILSRDYTANTE
jgi:outer membrane protein OmpA-like peptidoglycan-associated protein/tetratricopeptide (TPR) repeat protein